MNPQPTEPPAPAGSGCARILLVDDNHVNQRVLVALLHRAGYRTTVANSGLEALSQLEREAFDLILMDVMMPEMDGLRCTRLIRQREKVTGGHVPIVAVTAHASAGERERCLQSGMDDFLSKPVCPEELARSMARLLGRTLALGGGVGGQVREEPGWLKSLREMGFDEEGIGQLIAAFELAVPERSTHLRQAIASANLDAIHQIAHTLKGSLAVFADAGALAAVTSILERSRRGQAGGYDEALSELENGVARLRESMRTALDRPADRPPSGTP